jgi:hypothetical protein
MTIWEMYAEAFRDYLSEIKGDKSSGTKDVP